MDNHVKPVAICSVPGTYVCVCIRDDLFETFTFRTPFGESRPTYGDKLPVTFENNKENTECRLQCIVHLSFTC